MGTIINSVAVSSTEQASGIEEVRIANSEMENVTQTNSASTEELAAQAEELLKIVNDLKDIAGNDTGSQNIVPNQDWNMNTPEYASPALAISRDRGYQADVVIPLEEESLLEV